MAGQWITCEGLPPGDAVFLARKAWELPRQPGRVLIHVSADTRYALYFNGNYLGNGPVKGGKKTYFRDTHDVTALARAGRNFLAAEVRYLGRPVFNALPAAPALFVETEGLQESGGPWQARPDPSRAVSALPYTHQIGAAECRDLRRERREWQTFSDSPDGWKTASVLSSAPGARFLADSGIPPLAREAVSPAYIVSGGHVVDGWQESIHFADLMQTEKHTRTEGVAILDGSLLRLVPGDGRGAYAIIDFGREVFGSIETGVEAPGGGVLDMGYGDALYDGRVKTFSGTSSYTDGYRFADRHVLRPGRQRIGHYLHDRGFRYLQLVLRGTKEPVLFESLQVTGRAWPVRERAAFECDDAFLNRLWLMCADTLGLCATDTFIDCPWREQAFWVCDTLTVFPYWLGFTGDGRLPARCLRLAAEGQRDDGLIPSVYPSPEIHPHTTFPSMPAIWTLMLGDYHFHTGDDALVRELLPVMEKALAVYEKWAVPGGLVPNQPGMWNFIEWASPGSRLGEPSGPRGMTAVLNLLIASAWRAAARLYRADGQGDKAAFAERACGDLTRAVIEKFWCAERGNFRAWTETPGIFSQHAVAVALEGGLLDPSWSAAAVSALLDPSTIKADFYYQHFVLQALARSGHGAAALETIREGWGEMAAAGSHTVWETRRGKEEFSGTGSLCHAFSCAPLHFMQTVLLGVRPLRPGFSEFSLAPQSLGLRFVRGTIPTPRGTISVAWEKTPEGTLRLNADVPPSTAAMLPDGRRLEAGRHSLTLDTCEN